MSSPYKKVKWSDSLNSKGNESAMKIFLNNLMQEDINLEII